jgi:hypothetical protein
LQKCNGNLIHPFLDGNPSCEISICGENKEN